MKIAFISTDVPPSDSGQATVIYRMLRPQSPIDYCLISIWPAERFKVQANEAQRLPCNYYHLPPGFELTRGYRFGLGRYIKNANFILSILQYGWRVAKIVRLEKCDAIVASTGDAAIIPAGYLASRLTGVPFYSYVFDHYSYREWLDPMLKAWTRRLEPILLRGAAGVITPNDLLRDDLHKRFGVDATVIYNSFDLSTYETTLDETPQKQAGEAHIVYTGMIYEAHFDAFHNLLAALDLVGRPEISLHVYSAQPLSHLQAHGIVGPVVHHPFEALAEMPRVQRQADVLFLPLAFKSPYPELVRTSATTKLGEYLAARRPILVHAPADSFVSWYFRQHECGLVVDELDARALAQAVTRLLGDHELRRRLTARAWQRAQKDFNIATARARFLELISSGAV